MNIYLETSRFWENQFRNRLEQKEWDIARRFFLLAKKWKLRAEIAELIKEII